MSMVAYKMNLEFALIRFPTPHAFLSLIWYVYMCICLFGGRG
uniref:Uncharacterized protein n=1 Tax=Rhizophora mucronata TaxID=61149 RepID=A0A2P2NTY4_RHIMU